MTSPLADTVAEPADDHFVTAAQGGDRTALEQLVARHGPWIFNVAARMVWRRDDASDVTQEVLVKMITRLSTFRGESAFRTWLYRIVVNHVITLKKKPPLEDAPQPYEAFGRDLDEGGDTATSDEPGGVPAALLVEEAKIGCTLAMLMCLDRRQRIVFVLGEILGVTDRVGGDVTELTPENFRQVLARARRDLYSFMNGKCGLVNEANPCRCARKTRGFIDKGYVDPKKLQFIPDKLVQIRAVTPSRVRELDALERLKAKYGDPSIRVLPGHGAPSDPALFDRMRVYLDDFVSAVSSEATNAGARPRSRSTTRYSSLPRSACTTATSTASRRGPRTTRPSTTRTRSASSRTAIFRSRRKPEGSSAVGSQEPKREDFDLLRRASFMKRSSSCRRFTRSPRR